MIGTAPVRKRLDQRAKGDSKSFKKAVAKAARLPQAPRNAQTSHCSGILWRAEGRPKGIRRQGLSSNHHERLSVRVWVQASDPEQSPAYYDSTGSVQRLANTEIVLGTIMREFWEFRIMEEHAHRLFADDEGKCLGEDVRKIIIAADDPRFNDIGRLQDKLRGRDDVFFLGNDLQFRYTKREIEDAELFDVWITAVFEPSGEECGTIFDESESCEQCGAGRRQVSDLVLDLRKTPKNKQIARTIATEWIVTQQLAELMVDAKLTGFDLGPIKHKARYQDEPMELSTVPSGRQLLEQAAALGLEKHEWDFNVWLNRDEQTEVYTRARAEHAERLEARARKNFKPMPVWYQLLITSKRVPMVPPTRAGNDPFDDDPEDEERCPYGHVIGCKLLSEVSVSREAWDGSDVVCTSNLTGPRRGLCVPRPSLLISPRFYHLLREHKIRGYKADVAYLV